MVLPHAEFQTEAAELNLLYDWDRSLYPPEPKRAVIGAAAIHVVVFLVVLFAPSSHSKFRELPEVRVNVRRATPLYAPKLEKFELTQKAPNKGQVSKEVTLEALLPKPQQTARPGPQARRYTPPAPVTRPDSQLIAQAPDLPVMQGNPQIQLPVTAPIPINDKPKIAFEAPGARVSESTGAGKIPVPKTTVDDAVRASTRTRTGGVVVSDVMDLPTAAGATLSNTPNRGKAGSSLELLSDPQGVDFKPYLIRVLAAVRRNWFAVIPESARFGQRGRVLIQFAISREGRVPKLVISSPSGAESLDRAAVAGISASNPFPPLPTEFKGGEIRLQLSFQYNMPAN